MTRLRCAIYTRKSTEEGLEQDFNSLHAQRAACAAYIASQASEGWELVPTAYDDGGISGGTLDRPGLQKLLADIAAHRIDIVLVYKVDRLTRSLLDFAKLVEAFDTAKVSFVSVTQSFNTTNSIGRLTLNMLLSFAQFEREVTAERIRDKIAASKQRGMWMGGTPPWGYTPINRNLVVVEEEANLVRHIYDRYLALGTVRELMAELAAAGIEAPLRTKANGGIRPAHMFTRAELFCILGNPIYDGRIRHRGASWPGLHDRLIPAEQWQAAQQQLAANRKGEHPRTHVRHASPLAGRVFDPYGEPLIATHCSKGKLRYRYYISRSLNTPRVEPASNSTGTNSSTNTSTSRTMRVPALDLEKLLTEATATRIEEPWRLLEDADNDETGNHGLNPHRPDNNGTLNNGAHNNGTLNNRAAGSATTTASLIADIDDATLQRARAIASDLRARLAAGNALLRKAIARCTIHPDHIDVEAKLHPLLQAIHIPAHSQDRHIRFMVMASIRRSGKAVRFIREDGAIAAANPTETHNILAAIARARSYWDTLSTNRDLTVRQLASREQLDPGYLGRIPRLAFLDPKLVEQFAKRTAPASITLRHLLREDIVQPCWQQQRQAFADIATRA